MNTNRSRILFLIVLCQFCCTSLWFAGNGIMSDLITNFDLAAHVMGYLTSAVQLGFICGTLIFAVLSIADRYSPSKVFFCCAIAGAGFNLLLIYPGNELISLIAIRFTTGFFLAGIYPVGMKIAADYFHKDLGKSLGFLVGALVLGTALPHLINALTLNFHWHGVVYTVSLLAAAGGMIMIVFVPDGPYRKQGTKVELLAAYSIFKNVRLRQAAFGYFGHMWELYAFWTFVPVMLRQHLPDYNTSLWSFIIIAIGSAGCIAGGLLSTTHGSHKVAFISLGISLACCLLSPWVLLSGQTSVIILLLLIWGVAVIADSPMFSTLVAGAAMPATKGTALTIVNCIGFAITIVSIQLLSAATISTSSPLVFGILAIGPVLGLITIRKSNQAL